MPNVNSPRWIDLKAALLAAAELAADDKIVVFDKSDYKLKATSLGSLLRCAASGLTLSWTWDSGTAANPGTGKMRFNNATLASVTGLEISETAVGSVSAQTFLAQATPGSRIIVRKEAGGGQVLAVFTAGATTDNGTHRSIAVTHVYSAGAFADEDEVEVSIQAPGSVAAVVAALTGAGGGTVDGALEDEGVVTTSGGNTYSDTAVNAVLGKLKNNVAELAAGQAAILTALKNAGLMATS